MLTRSIPPAVAVVLAGMAAFAPLQPAAAEDRPVFVYGDAAFTRVEHVKFADIDLQASAGARKLESRVNSAVKRVCLFESDVRLQPSDYHACAAESWARAQPQIDRAVARAQGLARAGQPATIGTAILVGAR